MYGAPKGSPQGADMPPKLGWKVLLVGASNKGHQMQHIFFTCDRVNSWSC